MDRNGELDAGCRHSVPGLLCDTHNHNCLQVFLAGLQVSPSAWLAQKPRLQWYDEQTARPIVGVQAAIQTPTNSRIIRDKAICGGEPMFNGTRVTLRTVLASLAA